MQAQPDSDGQKAPQTLADALGQVVRECFTDASSARVQYEEEWLKDIRQYNGVYEADDLKNMKRSKAFIRLTRTKVKTMDARMMDMLFPGGTDQNWGVESTSVPEVSDFQKKQVVQNLIAAMQSEGIDPSTMPPIGDEEISAMVAELAKKAASKMQTEIADQLMELKYQEVVRDVLHSGHLLGTGVLKGPLVDKKTIRHWNNDPQSGAFIMDEKQVRRPYAEYVSLFDYYPDLSVMNHDQCEFEIQRHVMAKADVRKLKNRPSFNGAKITEYLRANPQGDADYRWHETALLSINGKLDTLQTRRRKYEVLEYWGYADGQMLRDCGCELSEDQLEQEFEAQVWVIGNTTIKAVLNPTEQKQRPFHLYYFEKDDTSLLGTGVPAIVRDTQRVFNAAIRAALDNAAITAGPQIEVNKSLLDDDEDVENIYPFKIWVRGGAGIDGQSAAIRVLNIESHVDELLKLADMFKMMLDETSTIPSYMHGEQDGGVGQTVGGLSMLMGAANITQKDTLRNYDNGITKPFITAMYHWNMQFGDNDDIKGDFDVKVTGSTTLVAKEIFSNQLGQFAQTTANPIDAPWIKRGELNRQREKALDLKGIVKTDEEFEEDMKKAMAAQAGADPRAQGSQAGLHGGAPGAPTETTQGEAAEQGQ